MSTKSTNPWGLTLPEQSLNRFRQPTPPPSPDGKLARRPILGAGYPKNAVKPKAVRPPRDPIVISRLPPTDKNQKNTTLAEQAAKVGESIENLIRHPAFTRSLMCFSFLGIGYATGTFDWTARAIPEIASSIAGTIANDIEIGKSIAEEGFCEAALIADEAAGGILETAKLSGSIAVGAGLIAGIKKITDKIVEIEEKWIGRNPIKALTGTALGNAAAAGLIIAAINTVANRIIEPKFNGELYAAVGAAEAIGLASGMAAGPKEAAAVTATAILIIAGTAAALDGESAVAGVAGSLPHVLLALSIGVVFFEAVGAVYKTLAARAASSGLSSGA